MHVFQVSSHLLGWFTFSAAIQAVLYRSVAGEGRDIRGEIGYCMLEGREICAHCSVGMGYVPDDALFPCVGVFVVTSFEM